MAFELVVGIGRRDAIGGPIVRLSGKFNGIPAGASGVNLMITDCKTVRRIKRLNRGAGGDAAFSLVESELAPSCAGLDSDADWHVFGQTGGTPPATSLGVKFPKSETGHDSESHNIRELKKDVIAGLKTAIKSNRTKIGLLDALARALDAYATSEHYIDWIADRTSELSAKTTDEMAELAKENERMEREIERREAQYKRQFGR